MAGFLKFPSVGQDWLPMTFADDDFQTAEFAVTEKIDGANIQWLFDNDQPWRVGKRTGFVERGEEFFNLWEVAGRYRDFIEQVASYCATRKTCLRMFGELYGSGVLQRIDYRTSGAMCFFKI